jgi:hypothetical protein
MEQPQRTQRSQNAATRIDSAFVVFALSAVKIFMSRGAPHGAWQSALSSHCGNILRASAPPRESAPKIAQHFSAGLTVPRIGESRQGRKKSTSAMALVLLEMRYLAGEGSPRGCGGWRGPAILSHICRQRRHREQARKARAVETKRIAEITTTYAPYSHSPGKVRT